MPRNLLIVDDEENILYSLRKLLTNEGYVVETTTSPTEALTLFDEHAFDAVLLDYKMPEMDGITLMKELFAKRESIPIIMMTAYGTTDTTIEAISAGAVDYLTKPFEASDLTYLLETTLSEEKQEKIALTPVESDTPTTIIGQSKVMQEVYKKIGQIAKNDINVLITGESGTGKELVAKTIWKYGRRANERFVAINCSAIPNELLESELFGYEKGAFTGANQAKAGKFELANKGTLFLDEIGDMPLSLQAKLLRVLQDGKIERLGGTSPVKTDVRVISATNKNIEEYVKEKTFREDLYYRINVVHIKLPSLRERKEDIKPLVEHFIAKYNRFHDKAVTEITVDAVKMLESHYFEGNVRELENIINRAVAVCNKCVIEVNDIVVLDQEPHSDDSFKKVVYKNAYEIFQYLLTLNESERPRIMATIEETIIKMALEHFNYNQVHTANFLGITRNTLRKRMEWYDML